MHNATKQVRERQATSSPCSEKYIVDRPCRGGRYRGRLESWKDTFQAIRSAGMNRRPIRILVFRSCQAGDVFAIEPKIKGGY